MKDLYLDLIDRAVAAYSEADIAAYTRDVREKGLTEHGYPRLTANIGILPAHGLHPERLAYFPDMMDLCCREVPEARDRPQRAGNEFSVKELIHCLREVEAAGLVPQARIDGWKAQISSWNAYDIYYMIAPRPTERINNWAAFAAASEQTRIAAGLGGDPDFVENQIQSQLLSFDENGMYRDPHEPMVYDLVTRLQLALTLHNGYDGPGRAALEAFMRKGAEPALLMQSVTGEIPFGGRSNQFLHNETFYAALCEFYAAWFAREGDMDTAGQFRTAARLAAESILPWLNRTPVHHIKNRFPLDSKIGCEGYGYFNKYMVTMGSWACLCYLFADDSIPEVPCPAMRGGYAWQTGAYFHKVFLSAGGYFAEFDTAADTGYDASGLGRIHKKGAPSALLLSVPFAVNPHYTLPEPNPGPLSVSPGAKTASGWRFGSDPEAVWTCVKADACADAAEAAFTCALPAGPALTLTARVDAGGVTLTVTGAPEVGFELPVFLTDGETPAAVAASPQAVTASCAGHQARWVTTGTLTDTGVDYVNRNGTYRRFVTEGKDTVTLRAQLAEMKG